MKGKSKRDSNGRFVKGAVPSNKIVLPEKELKYLYTKMGSGKIAEYYGVGQRTVLRNLREYNISIKNSGAPKSRSSWIKGLTKETDDRVKKISDSLKGEKSPNWKPEHHTDEMIECKCGCGELRPKYDKRGRERSYIEGHSRGGRFKKGLVPWNKNGTMPESSIKRGKEASGYKDGRALKLNYCVDCGKEIKYNSKRCVDCAHKGEFNSAWLGGISFEPYGLDFNDELKEQIRKRDNYVCRECDITQEKLGRKLDVHHIDYDKTNNDPNNLISLCASCHSKTSFNREYWKKYFQSKQR